MVEILSRFKFFFDVGITICLLDHTPCGFGGRTRNDLNKREYPDQK